MLFRRNQTCEFQDSLCLQTPAKGLKNSLLLYVCKHCMIFYSPNIKCNLCNLSVFCVSLHSTHNLIRFKFHTHRIISCIFNYNRLIDYFQQTLDQYLVLLKNILSRWELYQFISPSYLIDIKNKNVFNF